MVSFYLRLVNPLLIKKNVKWTVFWVLKSDRRKRRFPDQIYFQGSLRMGLVCKAFSGSRSGLAQIGRTVFVKLLLLESCLTAISDQNHFSE